MSISTLSQADRQVQVGERQTQTKAAMTSPQPQLLQAQQQQQQPPPLLPQQINASISATKINQTTTTTNPTINPTISLKNSTASTQSSHASQQHQHNIGKARGHQRRQSVARLLPDVSKLRLLSWLLEASSELLKCDVAIMDGVFAKANRGQESLLFAASSAHNSQQVTSSPTPTTVTKQTPPKRPQPPASVALYNYQQRKLSHLNYCDPALLASSPVPSSSSFSSTLPKKLPRQKKQEASQVATSDNKPASSTPTLDLETNDDDLNRRLQHLSLTTTPLRDHNLDSVPTSNQCDQISRLTVSKSNVAVAADEGDDDDDNLSSDSASSSTPSTSSSGIQGSGHSSYSSSSAASSEFGSNLVGNQRDQANFRSQNYPSNYSINNSSFQQPQRRQQESNFSFCVQSTTRQTQPPQQPLTGLDYLRTVIRQTVLDHNKLQALLVNIIRQYERQRLAPLRKRQIQQQQQANDQNTRTSFKLIDLDAIAESLDDGCTCVCHGFRQSSRLRARTLPVGCEQQLNQANGRITNSTRLNRIVEQQRSNTCRLPSHRQTLDVTTQLPDDLLNDDQNEMERFSEKMCENCVETHYWLHVNDPAFCQQGAGNNNNKPSRKRKQVSTLSVAQRNANFVKMVQQQVRSILAKSIELIDLIRKEIKSPESIKQAYLIQCFAASIKLLTSVGCYVMPAHDIQQHLDVSSFILEPKLAASTIGRSLQSQSVLCGPPKTSSLGHHHLTSSSVKSSSSSRETTDGQQQGLFKLPASDFDNLDYATQSAVAIDYSTNGCHLADAPELPLRLSRRVWNENDDSNSWQQATPKHKATNLLSADGQNDGQASSSGASSSSSSASSSIARGSVQQSSVVRMNQNCDDDALSSSQFHSTLSLSSKKDKSFGKGSALMFDAYPHAANQPKFWQSFNFIKKLLQVNRQRQIKQQTKERRLYNNKVQNRLQLVIQDLIHFNKSQQLLATENGVNSLLTSMRNSLEFGLYLTLKLY